MCVDVLPRAIHLGPKSPQQINQPWPSNTESIITEHPHNKQIDP